MRNIVNCPFKSGRTDSGVSAKAQVIHFDAQTDIPDYKIPYCLQQILPDDISILTCDKANDDFQYNNQCQSILIPLVLL